VAFSHAGRKEAQIQPKSTVESESMPNDELRKRIVFFGNRDLFRSGSVEGFRRIGPLSFFDAGIGIVVMDAFMVFRFDLVPGYIRMGIELQHYIAD